MPATKTPVYGSHSWPPAAEHRPVLSNVPPFCAQNSPKSPVFSAALGTPAFASASAFWRVPS